MAVEFSRGDLSGSIDTTVTWGASVRAEDRDDRLIGKVNLDPTIGARVTALQAQGRYVEAQALALGGAGPLLGQLGRWQSEIRQRRSDLECRRPDHRAESGLAWLGSVRARLPVSTTSKPWIVTTSATWPRTRLAIAFACWMPSSSATSSFGDAVTGNFRVGKQVVSWGESTFIQGGINAINPVDVSRLARGRCGVERGVPARSTRLGHRSI
jgi:hypothetical protein